MTFKEKDLEHISLDLPDEWQIHDEDHAVSVMFNGLEAPFCGFFGIDLNDQYPEGWIDQYATIDPLTKQVTELYFNFVSNAGIENDRELNLLITNPTEGELIYKKLADKELDEWIDTISFDD